MIGMSFPLPPFPLYKNIHDLHIETDRLQHVISEIENGIAALLLELKVEELKYLKSLPESVESKSTRIKTALQDLWKEYKSELLTKLLKEQDDLNDDKIEIENEWKQIEQLKASNTQIPDRKKRKEAKQKLAERVQNLLIQDKITTERINNNHEERTRAHKMSQSSNDKYYEYMKEVYNKQKDMMLKVWETSYKNNRRVSDIKAIQKMDDRHRKFVPAFEKDKIIKYFDNLQSEITWLQAVETPDVLFSIEEDLRTMNDDEQLRLRNLCEDANFDNNTKEFSTILSQSSKWLYLLQQAENFNREAIDIIINEMRHVYIFVGRSFVKKFRVTDAMYDICELHEMSLTSNQFSLAMRAKPPSKIFALALNVLKFFGSDLQYCDSTLKANVMCVKVASTAQNDALQFADKSLLQNPHFMSDVFEVAPNAVKLFLDNIPEISSAMAKRESSFTVTLAQRKVQLAIQKHFLNLIAMKFRELTKLRKFTQAVQIIPRYKLLGVFDENNLYDDFQKKKKKKDAFTYSNKQLWNSVMEHMTKIKRNGVLLMVFNI